MAFFALGTGIGGGVVIDGRLRLGPLGAAGELGHQTILPDGPRCGCGNRGCLETLASGPAIAAEGVRLLASGLRAEAARVGRRRCRRDHAPRDGAGRRRPAMTPSREAHRAGRRVPGHRRGQRRRHAAPRPGRAGRRRGRDRADCCSIPCARPCAAGRHVPDRRRADRAFAAGRQGRRVVGAVALAIKEEQRELSSRAHVRDRRSQRITAVPVELVPRPTVRQLTTNDGRRTTNFVQRQRTKNRSTHGLHLRTNRQDDRPLAAQSDADGRGAGGGLPSWRWHTTWPVGLHHALLPPPLRRIAAPAARSRASTTIGFPHGGHTTAIKLAEAEQALADGGRSWTWWSTSARSSAATGTTCARTSGRSSIVTHMRPGPEGQSDLRELLSAGRAQDPAVRDLRRIERRLGQDLRPATAPAGPRSTI